MTTRSPLTAALFAVLLAAGCGGDTDATAEGSALGDPEEALQLVLDEQTKGQWSRSYQRLHPAQQELLSEERFIACMDPIGVPITIDVMETFEEDVTIPGTTTRTTSLALTYEGTATVNSETESRISTTHLIDVDGEWRWYLADPDQC